MDSTIEAARKILTDQYYKAASDLKTFPVMADGRHSDEVKSTPEWKQAMDVMATAFTTLRAFNTKYKPS